MRIGILHLGACCPGMNAAVRAVVRLGIAHGHTLFGITNGFDGLLNHELKELKWINVNGWAKEGAHWNIVTHPLLHTHTHTCHILSERESE